MLVKFKLNYFEKQAKMSDTEPEIPPTPSASGTAAVVSQAQVSTKTRNDLKPPATIYNHLKIFNNAIAC